MQIQFVVGSGVVQIAGIRSLELLVNQNTGRVEIRMPIGIRVSECERLHLSATRGGTNRYGLWGCWRAARNGPDAKRLPARHQSSYVLRIAEDTLCTREARRERDRQMQRKSVARRCDRGCCAAHRALAIADGTGLARCEWCRQRIRRVIMQIQFV